MNGRTRGGAGVEVDIREQKEVDTEVEMETEVETMAELETRGTYRGRGRDRYSQRDRDRGKFNQIWINFRIFKNVFAVFV